MKAESQHTGHVTPLGVYLMVGLALMTLTAVTVMVSKMHLGAWNAIVALAIASIKGLLVAFFFMHLYYDKKIYALVVSVSLVMLSILIALTMSDVLRRGDIYEIQGYPIKPQAKIYDGRNAGQAGSAHSLPQGSASDTTGLKSAVVDTSGSGHKTGR